MPKPNLVPKCNFSKTMPDPKLIPNRSHSETKTRTDGGESVLG